MTEAGLRVMEAAKADGSWAFLDAIEALEIPGDLERELAGTTNAREGFDAYPESVRKQLLYWIATAKRPATRARRIAQTIAWAASGERPSPGGPRMGAKDG